MKKLAISIVSVAFAVLLLAGSANALVIPPACENCTGCPGLTPGFWKHNLKVYLTSVWDEDLTNGAYSAAYDLKMSDIGMGQLLGQIRDAFGLDPSYSLQTLAEELLAALEGPGNSMDRTNAANWFNWFMGLTPY